jgi:hypothetical protein
MSCSLCEPPPRSWVQPGSHFEPPVLPAVAQLLSVRPFSHVMFIESPATESDEEFRAYVTELLTSIYGRMPKWLEFSVGRRVEFRGVSFRQFVCVAGSVSAHIHLRASQPGGVARAILDRGHVQDEPHCWQIRSGVETEIDCNEIRTA